MNLILLEPGEVDGQGVVRLSETRARHVLDTLKAGPGKAVRIAVLDGPRGTGIVESTDRGSVALRCVFETAIPAWLAVDLLLALPRPKVMRRLWAQIAAMGVGRIVLTNAERVERNYFDAHVLRPEHYRPLLMEGLQQARDTRLPTVSIHRQFKVLIEDELDGLCPRGLRLVADPRAMATASDAVRQGREDRTLLAIGPEGGWNTFEMALLERHGFQSIGMGPRTLRTDTACVALLALVHDAIRSACERPSQASEATPSQDRT